MARNGAASSISLTAAELATLSATYGELMRATVALVFVLGPLHPFLAALGKPLDALHDLLCALQERESDQHI